MKKLDQSPHFGSCCEPSSLPGVVRFLRRAPDFEVHLAGKGDFLEFLESLKRPTCENSEGPVSNDT